MPQALLRISESTNFCCRLIPRYWPEKQQFMPLHFMA
jgi:hypothetical protein